MDGFTNYVVECQIIDVNSSLDLTLSRCIKSSQEFRSGILSNLYDELGGNDKSHKLMKVMFSELQHRDL